jgi:hypothetical protein
LGKQDSATLKFYVTLPPDPALGRFKNGRPVLVVSAIATYATSHKNLPHEWIAWKFNELDILVTPTILLN